MANEAETLYYIKNKLKIPQRELCPYDRTV